MRGLDLFGNRNGEEEKLLFKQDTEDCKMEEFGVDTKFPATYYHQIVVGNIVMFRMLQSALESRTPLHPAPTKFAIGGGKGKGSSQSQVVIPSATFEDGLYIRTVLDAIHVSSSSGQWVDIPKDNLVEMNNANPFWTSSTAEPSPKTHRPVFV